MYNSIPCFIYKDDQLISSSVDLIAEASLEIIVNEVEKTLIMFTPGNTRELVFGFLFTEGRIESITDIQSCEIEPSADNGEEAIEARVKIPKMNSGIIPSVRKKVSYASGSVYEKKGRQPMSQVKSRVTSDCMFDLGLLKQLPEKLYNHQPLYQRTGGAHAAALFDSSGNLLFCHEDMGRHSALDKVIGASLLKDVSFDDKILISSGRASQEMINKTARAGVPLYIANSRPTSKSVEAAENYNITLLDMARGGIQIYSHVQRVQGF